LNPSCTILLNARAGALKGTLGVDQMRQMAEELELPYEVLGTETPEEMRATLRRLVQGGAERVAVAGGDGTIHLAVQELACTETALGIIPQGTANNFATALRLPSDVPSALRVLIEGDVADVDLGRAGSMYFTESAGVGLFADALTIYGKGTNKNVFRALYALVRLLANWRARRVAIEMDGRPHVERAVMCTAANSFRMAYAMPVAPGAKMTDGLLDVVVLGDLRLSEVWTYIRAIRTQMHGSLPKVTMERARTVKIFSGRPMNVHCDDQVIGMTPIELVAVPRALRVVVDKL
jgi:diacylglycerol kinase (ATP)